MNLSFDRSVFILGAHKSGTSLMRSLLDGHKELMCLPRELHFFQASSFPFQYPLRTPIRPITGCKFSLEQYREFLINENNQGSEYSDNPGIQIDIDAFGKSFSKRQPAVTLKDHFENYTAAVVESFGRGLMATNGGRIVEKSVENFEFFPLLQAMYPAAKFIHIVRNPYATIIALRKAKMTTSYPGLGDFIGAVEQSMIAAWRNRFLTDRYLVVRYEDLVTSTSETMKNIARFIEIEFDETLMHPTVGSNAWGGNSSYGDSFSAVSTNSVNRWAEEINSLEMWAVNRRLKTYLELFNYEIVQSSYPWLPMKRERLGSFLSNRIRL